MSFRMYTHIDRTYHCPRRIEVESVSMVDVRPQCTTMLTTLSSNSPLIAAIKVNSLAIFTATRTNMLTTLPSYPQPSLPLHCPNPVTPNLSFRHAYRTLSKPSPLPVTGHRQPRPSQLLTMPPTPSPNTNIQNFGTRPSVLQIPRLLSPLSHGRTRGIFAPLCRFVPHNRNVASKDLAGVACFKGPVVSATGQGVRWKRAGECGEFCLLGGFLRWRDDRSCGR